jgi:hypothetical protein
MVDHAAVSGNSTKESEQAQCIDLLLDHTAVRGDYEPKESEQSQCIGQSETRPRSSQW